MFKYTCIFGINISHMSATHYTLHFELLNKIYQMLGSLLRRESKTACDCRGLEVRGPFQQALGHQSSCFCHQCNRQVLRRAKLPLPGLAGQKRSRTHAAGRAYVLEVSRRCMLTEKLISWRSPPRLVHMVARSPSIQAGQPAEKLWAPGRRH